MLTIDKKGITRFFKYTGVGGVTFALDLLLLYILVDHVGWPAPLSAAFAFLIAVSSNYMLSRRFVFRGTLRSVGSGYVGFLLIASLGLAVVTGGMYVLVQLFALPYLYARIAVACVTGIWNYLLNLYVNFNVAGVRTES